MEKYFSSPREPISSVIKKYYHVHVFIFRPIPERHFKDNIIMLITEKENSDQKTLPFYSVNKTNPHLSSPLHVLFSWRSSIVSRRTIIIKWRTCLFLQYSLGPRPKKYFFLSRYITALSIPCFIGRQMHPFPINIYDDDQYYGLSIKSCLQHPPPKIPPQKIIFFFKRQKMTNNSIGQYQIKKVLFFLMKICDIV